MANCMISYDIIRYVQLIKCATIIGINCMSITSKYFLAFFFGFMASCGSTVSAFVATTMLQLLVMLKKLNRELECF